MFYITAFGRRYEYRVMILLWAHTIKNKRKEFKCDITV